MPTVGPNARANSPFSPRLRRLLRSPVAVVPLLLIAALPNLRLPPLSRPVEERTNLDGYMKLRGIERDPRLRAALGYFIGDDPQRVHTFRPLPAFTLWVDYHIFGYLNWPYVLVNWLWFVATGVAVWLLCRTLSLPDWAALAVAASTMCRITRGTRGTLENLAARHDVVCVLFAVLAVHFLLRYLQSPRHRHLAGFVITSLAAYLSKEMAVALLPISLALILWHWLATRRRPDTPPDDALRPLFLAAGASVALFLIWFAWYRLAERNMGPPMPTHTVADWQHLLGARWEGSLSIALKHLCQPLGELIDQFRAGVGWAALWYPMFWRRLFALAVQVTAITLLWRRRPLWLLTLYAWKIATWLPVMPLNATWPWY
jgi:hypothetical protein